MSGGSRSTPTGFGGGAAFVFFRNEEADVALHVDLARVQANEVGAARVGLSATTLTFGLSCAFDPDALAL